MKEQKVPCRKKTYDKVGFDLKLLIIDNLDIIPIIGIFE